MEQLISGTVDTQKQSTIALGNTNAGDNTIIELTIKSNGVLLEYDNPTFELLAKKSDNTRVRQIKDITLEEGKIKIKCDIQLVLCEGLVTNQLYITDGDRISTVYFYFNVNPSLENEVLEESKDKIESLDKLDQLIGVSFDNLEEYEKRLLEFSASMTGIEEAESKRNANELIRSSEELARSTSEEVRINSEEDRVIAENERVANEQERQLSEEDRITNENNRRLAENTRKSQENSRVQAEAERQGIFEENENIRKEQEAKRVQAESTREEKNRTWEEREGIRLISEDQRRESEEARQLAETERDKSEKLREQQENNRQLTYNKFNADEEERISNENIRKTQEDSRNKAELLRQQQEEKRVSAENTRNDSYKASETNRENTFIENENRRQSSYESAELNRNNTFDTEEIKRKNSYQDAENTRNNAFEVNEANRQNEYTAAERLRVENENLRKNNEVARGSNEDERKNNENLRNQSENSRVEEEKARVLAEGKRVEAEQTRVNEFNTMKLENETFKQGINEQYEDIITKNTEFKEQMNTDFGNAKTDYFGEEHLNVVDRLNSDFDNVHQRINDSSYLEYSGTNITADNSYYGLTKDMFIKGRLLQNLVSMSMSNVSNYSALSVESGYFKLQATGDWSMAYYMKSKTLLKPSTKYTILLEVKENTLNDGSFTLNQQQNTESCFNGQLGVIKSQITGVYKYVGTTSSDLDSCKYAMRTFLSTQATSGYILFRYMILEGDYTNTPISELPYFEGITSVGENEDNLVKIKSHNKNFFKLRDMPLKLSKGVTCTVDDDLNFTIKSDATSGSYPSVYVAYPKEMFEGKKFTLSCDVVNENPDIAVTVQVNYLKIDGTYSYIAFGGTKNTHTFPNTIQSDIVNIQMCVNNKSTTGVVNSMVVSNLMCEENTVKTEYVEYKESIQELLLDEPLRDLPNGTCDEILEDGTEIRRVGKLEIDTSLFIKVGTYNEGVYRWKYTHPSVNGNIKGHILSVRCDKLPTISANDTWGHMGYKDGIAQNSGNLIIIYLDAYNDGSELSKANMVKKLGTITVYYELAEPIITEHNKNINLKTFEGKTHITSDNYLLPTLSCKVPSNVQAVVMSLKEENQELNNTITEMSLESEEQNLSNIETNLDQDVRLTMLELGVM